MDLIQSICATAIFHRRHIVLSEGEDPRVVEAGLRAVRDGIADISFVGNVNAVSNLIGNHQCGSHIQIHDPSDSKRLDDYTQTYLELRAHKGVSEQSACDAVLSNLGFAAMMVRLGDADGTIGGAVATTADTVRTALQIIGVAPATSQVSSFFIMLTAEPDARCLAFADCALVVEPDAEELASIAVSTANSFSAMTGEKPRIAMLSFSTLGSAKHPSLDKITQATQIVRNRHPDLIIDGEIQFDAAFDADVALSKSPISSLQGKANVFVFPNLHAGNIGYKIAQRIGGARAVGPILQGLNKPANDLSRGCSAEDIYQMIAVTAVQAANNHDLMQAEGKTKT